MNSGLVAVLIVLAVVVLSIVTRRCVECLFAGSLLAAVYYSGLDCITDWTNRCMGVICDQVWLIMVTLIFGSFIALLTESHGTNGFTKIAEKICTNERRTLLSTFVLGVILFIDDYLNVLAIGTCMKNVFDKRKLPREALAYITDATGAPVCVLVPVSAWAVFYMDLFASQDECVALGLGDSISMYMSTVPFLFYPIFCLLIVFLFAAGILPKVGDMKKAYDRVAATGKTFSDNSAKFNVGIEESAAVDGNLIDFIIPMAVLIALTLYLGDILIGVIIAVLVCFVMYVPRKLVKFEDFFTIVFRGFADMMPVMTMLIVAFVLGGFLDDMGMTEFLIEVCSPFLTGKIFPAVCFVLVACLTFATGSLWGMCAIVAPIVFPMGAVVGANTLLIMACLISGGAFGSHACFFTDATLLSSSAAGIDNVEHSMSQLPYVLVGAGLTVIAYLICGFVM